MMTATVSIGFLKTIKVPDDVEVRISHEPRITSIQTIPHSPKGEDFLYNATKDERECFLLRILMEKDGEVER